MKNCTDITCILDQSGSMKYLTEDTLTGFNKFLQEQKDIPGEARFSLVLFSNYPEVLASNINLADAKFLDESAYKPAGGTALLDTIGSAIDTTGARLSSLPEEERPDKVVFFITTDGQENASSVYTASRIKEMIEHQQTKYNWTFIFSAANQDAFGTGMSLGISSTFTSNYVADSVGTRDMYRNTSGVLRSIRTKT